MYMHLIVYVDIDMQINIVTWGNHICLPRLYLYFSYYLKWLRTCGCHHHMGQRKNWLFLFQPFFCILLDIKPYTLENIVFIHLTKPLEWHSRAETVTESFYDNNASPTSVWVVFLRAPIPSEQRISFLLCLSISTKFLGWVWSSW